eukprot:719632-Amphidinium_carterae.2
MAFAFAGCECGGAFVSHDCCLLSTRQDLGFSTACKYWLRTRFGIVTLVGGLQMKVARGDRKHQNMR